MDKHYYIGIDPGLSGGIAVITSEGEVIKVFDPPIVEYKKGKKKKREYNVPYLSTQFKAINKTYSPCIAALEKMQSLPPGIRIQATFSLGYSQGFYEGILAALEIPYELIVPKTWQKSFEITSNKGDTKAQSYMIASKLFPGAEITGPRGGKKDGRSDALLIAEWLRRKNYGGER